MVTMNRLYIIYLLLTANYLTATLVITLILQHGSPLGNAIPESLRRCMLATYDFARTVDWAFQQLDSNMKKDFAKLSLIACPLDFLFAVLSTSALFYGLPLSFIPNINGDLTEDVIVDFLKYLVLTYCIGLAPYTYIVFSIFGELENRRTEWSEDDHEQTNDEGAQRVQVFQDFTSIQLKRYENTEETLIYAICHNDRTGTFFQFFLLQGKEEGSITRCFTYNDEDQIWEEISPAPFSVDELEQSLNTHDD